LPENVLQHHPRERNEAGEAQVADQSLVRETAVAVVGKLRSGEVSPLDLLDVLEQRIAEVDGKVNALPTLCLQACRYRSRT
jgi:amidase